jgi:hypothetical protein
VLEPAFESGFVDEATTTLGADAYVIRRHGLSPASDFDRWSPGDRNWLFTRRPRAELSGKLAAAGLRLL